MIELGWQAWVTVAVLVGVLVAFFRELAQPESILLAALCLLLVSGVLTPDEAFAGISNPALLTVGALFVLAAAIQKTGALRFLDGLMFPRKPGARSAGARIMLLTASSSAFLNNTPLVAMFMPKVQAWCEKHGIAPAKLMIPLSYASILGGMTTLIGTSTNLLVSGLLQAAGHPGLGLFDITLVGLPAAVVAILYLIVYGHRLLPERGVVPAKEAQDLANALFEVRVSAGSPLDGKTVEEAGLRALGDAYLVHIRRGEDIVPSAPDRRIGAGDVLSFSGHVAVLDRLRLMPDLEPGGVIQRPTLPMPLFEAVVAPSSTLVGKSLKEVGFRKRYDGVVLGVHRADENIHGPLGQVKIRPGDLLIVEARAGFDERWNGHDDEFFLVAPYRGTPAPVRVEKAAVALATLGGVVLAAALGLAPIVTAAFAGALIVLASGCITMREARRAINFKVLAVIAAALGIGRAVEASGLADAVGTLITNHVAFIGPIGGVAIIYVATALLTELITNNAAAALMLAIAMSAASQLGIPPEALAVTVAIAASASFLTPIGYQTNLMVMSAGGYRFSDYFRAGLPVSVIVAAVTVGMTWYVWL